MRRFFSVAVVLGLALTPQARASVTFLPNTAEHGLVHIELVNPGSFPASVVNGIGDGMGQWNHSDCNVNQERFPIFSMSAPAGSPTIQVEWITSEVGEVCAKAEDRAIDGSSTRVLLYSQVELPDKSIKNCYDSRAIANDSFAHENASPRPCSTAPWGTWTSSPIRFTGDSKRTASRAPTLRVPRASTGRRPWLADLSRRTARSPRNRKIGKTEPFSGRRSPAEKRTEQSPLPSRHSVCRGVIRTVAERALGLTMGGR